jgi:5-methylcytosine-specific restriction endonuclease McrA
VKRMTPEEAREWRKRSVARYQVTRQKPPSRSTKPISAQQARKRAEGAEYRRNRDMRIVRARGRCELQAPGCTQVATEAHHLMKRSHKLSHAAENLRASCNTCNIWVELNPAEARARGWVVTDWPKIGESPMES